MSAAPFWTLRRLHAALELGVADDRPIRAICTDTRADCSVFFWRRTCRNAGANVGSITHTRTRCLIRRRFGARSELCDARLLVRERGSHTCAGSCRNRGPDVECSASSL